MTQYGTWVSCSGDARIGLAAGQLAGAGGVTCAGIRLPLDGLSEPSPPGRPA